MSARSWLSRGKFLVGRGAPAGSFAHHPDLVELIRRFDLTLLAVATSLEAGRDLWAHIDELRAVAEGYRQFVVTFDCGEPHVKEIADARRGIPALARYIGSFRRLRTQDADALIAVLSVINQINRDFLDALGAETP